MRKPFVAGNWKMNTTNHSGMTLARAVAEGCRNSMLERMDIAVFPPFVYLRSVGRALADSRVAVGGQDLHWEQKGAFTGEISAAMLKDSGCVYALCGHSERRHVMGESDEIVHKKILAAVAGGLLVVVCAGELLEERQAGRTEQVVRRQVEAALAGLSAEKLGAVAFAYEPVWAIGTGKNATADQAQTAHAFIRGLIRNSYGSEAASETRILYGGSVKPGNARELMEQPDIDGLLVGGASLEAGDFIAILEASAHAKGIINRE